MRLLAVDTSGPACSAALLIDGDLRQRLEHAPRRHGELLLPMMEGLLGEARLAPTDLDAVAYGHGPGSFTGLRIAAAVVQGIAFGADLPVIGVSTLAALAQGCLRRDTGRSVLSALDARMGEVYWGAYRADGLGIMRACADEQVCAPEAVRLPTGSGWTGAGPGWRAYADVLGAVAAGRVDRIEPDTACEAQDIATLAADAFGRDGATSAADALPVYLRNQVTQPPKA